MKKFKGLVVCLFMFFASMALIGNVYAAANDAKIPVSGGGIPYYNIYDEDSMSSDSSTGLPTQQSVKAYADDPGDATLVTGVTEYTVVPTGKEDTLLIDKVAGSELAIAFPTITESLDGYVLICKQIDSGTSNTVISPPATDYIESTRGTFTGTSDSTINAVGDAKAFMADYVSGSTSVWRQLWSNQS